MLPPPPPPADALQVVHITSLAAALASLNIKIPIEDIIRVIHDEDKAKRVKVTAEATQRRAAISECKSTRPLSGNYLANASSRSPTNQGICQS